MYDTYVREEQAQLQENFLCNIKIVSQLLLLNRYSFYLKKFINIYFITSDHTIF